MALFRRSKKESTLPEIDKYYDGERRDRTSLAWLLALISVIIIALIIIGIFLAGRWLYREVTDTNDSNNVAIEETVPSFDGGSTDQSQSVTSDDTRNSQEDDQDQNDQSQADDTQDEEGVVDAPARTETPSTPGATPQTGDDALPGTGPAGLVGTFVGVSTLAGGIHYAVNRKYHGRLETRN